MSNAKYRLQFLDQATALKECEQKLLDFNAPSEIIRHVRIARTMLEEKFESFTLS